MAEWEALDTKSKREILNKVSKELKAFGLEVEIDFERCEVLGVRFKNKSPLIFFMY